MFMQGIKRYSSDLLEYHQEAIGQKWCQIQSQLTWRVPFSICNICQEKTMLQTYYCPDSIDRSIVRSPPVSWARGCMRYIAAADTTLQRQTSMDPNFPIVGPNGVWSVAAFTWMTHWSSWGCHGLDFNINDFMLNLYTYLHVYIVMISIAIYHSYHNDIHITYIIYRYIHLDIQ